MPTNGVAEVVDRRESEFQIKQEVGSMFESAVTGDWKVNQPNDSTPSSRTGQSAHASGSIDLNRDVVEELTLENYDKPCAPSMTSPNTAEAAQPKTGQWHLYQVAGGSKNIGIHGTSLSRARNELMMNARANLGQLSKHHEYNQDGPSLNDAENIACGSVSPPLNGLKISSQSGFSHYFKISSVKGKGVLNSGYPGTRNTLTVDPNDMDSRKAPPLNALNLNASFEYGGVSNQLPSNRIERLGMTSDGNGISLREWLKLGNPPISKMDRLLVFKQIVVHVDHAHSQGVGLLNLLPSYVRLMPSNKVRYTGSLCKLKLDSLEPHCVRQKRHREADIHDYGVPGIKQRRFIQENQQLDVTSGLELCGEMKHNATSPPKYGNYKIGAMYGVKLEEGEDEDSCAECKEEEKWYVCPEDVSDKSCTISSNVYNLGLIFFELFCEFDSLLTHSTAMMEIHHRIFPPKFLSENPKEAAFCMWLLHPVPSLRPTAREILQTEFLSGLKDLYYESESSSLSLLNNDYVETELLLDFLSTLKEQRQEVASKLEKDINCLEADIMETQNKHLSKACFNNETQHVELSTSVKRHTLSSKNKARLVEGLSQLETAYFSMRTPITNALSSPESVKCLLRNKERNSQVLTASGGSVMNKEYDNRLDVFSEGLCHFTRYSRFEVCGTVRSGEILSSASVMCSLCFDRDEDYVAAAGLSRKIKIFDVSAILGESERADIHYPTIEMVNRSKLSCISWNYYIKNYLASSDYEGVIKIWDASTGTTLSQYSEHQKRTWSVDFSQVDPTKLASGSDDGSVKLWSVNEKRSISTLWNPANVCCVQFSPYSSHFVAFGSADYKIYGYDLRHTRVPWCILPGHGKTVSFVKFIDSGTLVSASTDNTIKLWNLNKTSQSVLSSDACSLTLSGHTNEKNFVGLSVRDGYIMCGSETNEVFAYHKFLPMPITSHKFGSVDPMSGHETEEDVGHFVSSVCCGRKSNLVVAANSSGTIKLLKLV